MPGIARILMDTAGGPIIGGGNTRVLAEGSPVAVIGDAITSHGLGPHARPLMIVGSARVFAAGRPVLPIGRCGVLRRPRHGIEPGVCSLEDEVEASR